MTVHNIHFRITEQGGTTLGIDGPKSFHPDLTLIEADRLRERLLRLEELGLVTDIDLEPNRFGGEDEPIHRLLDLFDPVTLSVTSRP
jgi:hypothetical protein